MIYINKCTIIVTYVWVSKRNAALDVSYTDLKLMFDRRKLIIILLGVIFAYVYLLIIQTSDDQIKYLVQRT